MVKISSSAQLFDGVRDHLALRSHSAVRLLTAAATLELTRQQFAILPGSVNSVTVTDAMFKAALEKLGSEESTDREVAADGIKPLLEQPGALAYLEQVLRSVDDKRTTLTASADGIVVSVVTPDESLRGRVRSFIKQLEPAQARGLSAVKDAPLALPPPSDRYEAPASLPVPVADAMFALALQGKNDTVAAAHLLEVVDKVPAADGTLLSVFYGGHAGMVSAAATFTLLDVSAGVGIALAAVAFASAATALGGLAARPLRVAQRAATTQYDAIALALHDAFVKADEPERAMAIVLAERALKKNPRSAARKALEEITSATVEPKAKRDAARVLKFVEALKAKQERSRDTIDGMVEEVPDAYRATARELADRYLDEITRRAAERDPEAVHAAEAAVGQVLAKRAEPLALPKPEMTLALDVSVRPLVFA